MTFERRQVFYSGQVQGVGFRYTARRIAEKHQVAGWVKNLRDGRVELVAEGTAAELNRLLQAIAEAMRENIENVEIHRQPATGEFAGFEVAY